MAMPILLQGLVIGFCIAAPVGPVNLLCLRRSLTDGRRVGFVSGLGAATADTVYGVIAGFGMWRLGCRKLPRLATKLPSFLRFSSLPPVELLA